MKYSCAEAKASRIHLVVLWVTVLASLSWDVHRGEAQTVTVAQDLTGWICREGAATPSGGALIPNYTGGPATLATAPGCVGVTDPVAILNAYRMQGIANAQQQQLTALKNVQESNEKTNAVITEQIKRFNESFRESISQRFEKLPAEIRTSKAFIDFEADLKKYVNDQISASQAASKPTVSSNTNIPSNTVSILTTLPLSPDGKGARLAKGLAERPNR